MTGFQVEEATIESIHAAYLDGTLSATALTQAYLDRIATPWARDLNCILALDTERALNTAAALDRSLNETGRLVGPLHGIVTLVKDNILTEGLTTTCGSVVLADWVPSKDAAVVQRMREAGAIILGKTTMPDFATSWFSFSSVNGETRNPYSPDHDPGGSSSGSAAAVAANLATVALGTDCGGSVRLPASFCNLIGLRGTPGLVPRTGASALVDVHDTVGPLTRTMVDSMKVLDVIAGFDPTDVLSIAATIGQQPRSFLAAMCDKPAASTLTGLRIGVVVDAVKNTSPEEREVSQIMSDAVAALSTAGATVTTVEIPDLRAKLAKASLYAVASRFYLDQWLAGQPELDNVNIPGVIGSGRFHPALDLLESFASGPADPTDNHDYLRRLRAQDLLAEEIMAVMSANGLDGLTYPILTVPPPKNEDRLRIPTWDFPTNTLIASYARLPSVSVPAGFSSLGIPVGIEMVARRYDDALTHRMAYGFEQATKHRKPPSVRNTQ